MALRNTVRRPARTLLAVGMLAGAGAVFVAGVSLGSEVGAVAEEARAQRRWDVEVQLATPAGLAALTARIAGLSHVRRVEGWSTSMAGIAGPGGIPLTGTYPDQGHGGVVLTGMPAGEATFVLPRLSRGRWLGPGESGAIVLNQVIRTRILPGVAIGDNVRLFVGGKPSTWRVVGFVEETRGGAGGAYVTQEGFGKATGRPGQVNLLRLVTDRHEEPVRASIADAARAALDGAHLPVVNASSVSRAEAVDEGHLHPIIAVVLSIAIALGVLGGVGLASTMSANVLERTREFGIVQAIGAKPEAVRRIVVVEGVLLAVTSCVLAAVPALVATAILGAGLGHLFMATALPFRISILAVGIWLVLAVLIAACASEAPARRASRTSVREALAHL
jgi:putative ABC transport system permease protein